MVPKSCVLLISSKNIFADMKECNSTKITKNRGLFANMQKGIFWAVLGFLSGFVLFVLCAFVLLFCRRPKKAVFLQSYFFIFCFPKLACFRILLFFQLCFILLFSFCLPFQSSMFFFVFVHQPLFGTHYFWRVSFVFICLPFPNICFFI